MKYAKQHIKIDDSTIAQRDPAAVIEPLWWDVDIYRSKEKYKKDLAPYSFQQRCVFALMWYMAEVNNGDHLQFYRNSTGIVWEDVMKRFALVGISEGEDILKASAKIFGDKPSFKEEERDKILDTLLDDGDPFKDLDDRFYELDAKINIDGKIADYISSNPTPFYFEGEI